MESKKWDNADFDHMLEAAVELSGVYSQCTKVEYVHAPQKAYMTTVVLKRPVVHVLASIVTIAFEFHNDIMKTVLLERPFVHMLASIVTHASELTNLPVRSLMHACRFSSSHSLKPNLKHAA